MKKLFSRCRSQASSAETEFYRLLIPSILGMLLCAVCLAGGTFAWFQANTTVTMPPLQMAEYRVLTVVTDSDGIPPLSTEEGYLLSAGKSYRVILALSEENTASNGYCILSLNGTPFHTAAFPSPQEPDKASLSFTLTITQDTILTVTPQWGFSSVANENDKLNEGDILIYPESIVPAS